MSVWLRSIATAVPALSLDQESAARTARSFCVLDAAQRRKLEALYRRSGVERRSLSLLERSATGEITSRFPPARDAKDRGPGTAQRMVRYAEAAPELALEAARDALDRAATCGREITHLVTVSCTGFDAPGFDIALVKGLDLPPTVRRTHVGFMGCHGAVNGLHAVNACLAAEPGGTALLCAVELSSLHVAYGFEPDRVVPGALFADGAAAVVARREPGEAGPSGTPPLYRARAFGSVVIPGSESDMTWRIGDHGFEMTLSPRVPGLIREHLVPWLAAWLDGCGLELDEINSWAVHPGGPRILTAVEEALGLEREQLADSRAVLREQGNMSSPTLLFILERMREAHRPRPTVALGFGPGLVAEAVLLD